MAHPKRSSNSENLELHFCTQITDFSCEKPKLREIYIFLLKVPKVSANHYTVYLVSLHSAFYKILQAPVDSSFPCCFLKERIISI